MVREVADATAMLANPPGVVPAATDLDSKRVTLTEVARSKGRKALTHSPNVNTLILSLAKCLSRWLLLLLYYNITQTPNDT